MEIRGVDMNRETRLYFRHIRSGVKRHLTNNYKKLHGEKVGRYNTLYLYSKRRWSHRKTPRGKKEI